jgi:DNA-directed RNA polymerase subunit RPC12/RpoP
MQLACPQCGSRDARVSHRAGLGEWFKSLVGIFPLRCRRCKTRWSTSTWESAAWKYARCPKCYRQQLSTWSEQYYHPSGWTTFQLRIGATPYRCAACRCNFASFKKCKEKFAWRYQERPHTPPEVDSDSTVKH